MDGTTRARIAHSLEAASDRDSVVLAVMDDAGAVIHTVRPDPLRLVNLASSLLDQARDAVLDAGADDAALAEAIEDALEILPDRHADPAEAPG